MSVQQPPPAAIACATVPGLAVPRGSRRSGMNEGTSHRRSRGAPFSRGGTRRCRSVAAPGRRAKPSPCPRDPCRREGAACRPSHSPRSERLDASRAVLLRVGGEHVDREEHRPAFIRGCWLSGAGSWRGVFPCSAVGWPGELPRKVGRLVDERAQEPMKDYSFGVRLSPLAGTG